MRRSACCGDATSVTDEKRWTFSALCAERLSRIRRSSRLGSSGFGLDRIGLLIRGSDGIGLRKMRFTSNRGVVRSQITGIE